MPMTVTMYKIVSAVTEPGFWLDG